jgi:low affinity Fe/Cu permease
VALFIVIIWAVTGPVFQFSDTWQLVINTGTTIITFLMVFLIQSSQNRDTEAMQLKLDELIRAVRGANNALINLESDTAGEQDLESLKAHYEELAARARAVQERAREIESRSGHIHGRAKEIKDHVEEIEAEAPHVKDHAEHIERHTREIGEGAEEIQRASDDIEERTGEVRPGTFRNGETRPRGKE